MAKKDPVCGMEVEETKAKATTQYKKRTYYFCCEPCKEAFEKEPEKYVKEESSKKSCCG